MQAGIAANLERGRFVHLLTAAHPVEINTQSLGQGSNERSMLLANVGAEFQLFESATLVSDVDQTIVIAVSERTIFDNRLGVDGSLILETVERAASDFEITTHIADSYGVQILSGSVTNRRGAIISTSGPVVLSKSNEEPGGVFTVDGVLTFPASGSLYAWAESATMIEVMEFLN